MLWLQFLAWDTFARRRVDMIGRKDHGDEVIVHEFDYSVEKQVCITLIALPLVLSWDWMHCNLQAISRWPLPSPIFATTQSRERLSMPASV